MSLTGHAFPALLAVLAVLLLASLVLAWPHTGRRVVDAVLRGVTAVVMNIVVVLLAGTLLNDQYAFYVSWNDLLGVTSPAVQATGGGTAADVVKAKVQGNGVTDVAAPKVLPALPSPHSRLQKYTVQVPGTSMKNTVYVYLPEGYDQANPRKYPVIEAMHGYPSRADVFQHVNGFFAAFDKAVAEHRMAPSVIVMSDINPPGNIDTECVNVPGGFQAETWIAHDVPAWTVQHFHVLTTRTAWAAYGFSFGGWCAAMVGVRDPDVFGAAVVMQGYFRPDFGPSYVPFKAGSSLYKSYDLVSIARHHPPAVALWILASKQDSLSYPSTNALVKDARRPLSVTADLLKEGGHREAVWVPKIPTTLSWLGRTLPGFAPTS